VLEKDPKVPFIFDELNYINDDIPRTGIRHYPLYLPHFMSPKFAQVFVDVAPGFSPKLQISLATACSFDDSKLRGTQYASVAGRNRRFRKGESLLKRW
jgi:hypothetical protein